MPPGAPIASDDGTFGVWQMWDSSQSGLASITPLHSIGADPHARMNPQGSTSAYATVAPAGGSAHVTVGGLVLLALAGIFLLHFLGFRFATDVSVGR